MNPRIRTATAAAACGLLLCAAAAAQTLPERWRTRPLEGGTLYEPTDLPAGSRFDLWAPAPALVGEADGAQALGAIVRQDGLRGLDASGAAPDCAAAEESPGGVTQDCRVARSGKPVLSLKFIMLAPREGRARWLRITAMGNPGLLEKYGSDFKQVLGAALAAGTGNPAPAAQPEAQSAALPAQEIRRAVQARPGEGVKPGLIETVLFSWDQVYRVTGLQYEETVYLLFKDGSAYEELEYAPEDFNAEASRRLQPKRWVRWRKSGKDWQVQQAGSDKWKTLKAWPAIAGARGEKLKGTFTNYAYTSMGGFGGSAHFNSYTFQDDGSFEQSGQSSYGTGVMQSINGYAGGVTTTYSKKGTTSTSSVSGGGDGMGGAATVAGGSTSRRNDGASNVGRYRIDGWAIELQRDDGTVERKLFLYTSSKRDAINMGGIAYSLPRK
ncbi:MAG: hypothetical protein EPO12_06290 [Aquabacterium sp.]|nr:MAG: hypothetical protein EPO12_06290 [Aquabacterium sp.]